MPSITELPSPIFPVAEEAPRQNTTCKSKASGKSKACAKSKARDTRGKKKKISETLRDMGMGAEEEIYKCIVCGVIADSPDDALHKRRYGEVGNRWLGCDVDKCPTWGHAICVGCSSVTQSGARAYNFVCDLHDKA